MLLQYVPRHVTAGWPATSSSGEASTTTSGSTILEGLRLALGLGGDKASSAQGRLTAGGKLVFLKAVMSFVQQALDDGSVEERGLWDGWMEDVGGSKSKSSVIEIKSPGLEFDGMNEGWVVGCGDWAMETAAMSGWELGRLDTGGSASHGEAGNDTFSLLVSSHLPPYLDISNDYRIYLLNYIHYCYLLS